MQKNPSDWLNVEYTTIQTYTGRVFDYTKMEGDQICIEDIAHALSLQCRYNGHVKQFYSVAEHSVIVSHGLGIDFAKWGLLHDSAEAYVSDLPHPLKPLMPQYKRLEKAVMRVVAEKFNLSPGTQPDRVTEYDRLLCADEMYQLMTKKIFARKPMLGVEIECWTPARAEKEFLKRWMEVK